MLCSFGFSEHDKDIKYALNRFDVWVQSTKKEKTKLERCSFLVSLVLQVWKRDNPMPEDTLLDSEETRVFFFHK